MDKKLIKYLKDKRALVYFLKKYNPIAPFTSINNDDILRTVFTDFFFEYAKRKKIYNAFMQEIIKQNGNHEVAKHVFNIIDYSLSWRETKQGYEFWHTQHIQWRKYFKKMLNIK
jgi:hypothetical protein